MSNDSTKDDEESLFLREMADVTPISPSNKVKTRKKPVQRLHRPAFSEEDIRTTNHFSTAEISEDCPAILSFSRSGLQHSVLKKLRQGRNPIEYKLDLHGFSVAQARNALIIFLDECERAGIRHALIVHGKGFRSKGKPIIKPMINRWLQASNNVLALHSAQPKDGGSGAVYVLLKKSDGRR